jgi:hypothetical protein
MLLQLVCSYSPRIPNEEVRIAVNIVPAPTNIGLIIDMGYSVQTGSGVHPAAYPSRSSGILLRDKAAGS